jgi:hypothetical protein
MPREKAPARATATKRPPRKTPVKPRSVAASTPFVDPARRSALIAEAAYFRAEKRGFSPGHEAEDWLAAEADIDARLLHSEAATRV